MQHQMTKEDIKQELESIKYQFQISVDQGERGEDIYAVEALDDNRKAIKAIDYALSVIDFDLDKYLEEHFLVAMEKDVAEDALNALKEKQEREKMVKCPNCGLELHHSFRKCVRCGAKMEVAE